VTAGSQEPAPCRSRFATLRIGSKRDVHNHGHVAGSGPSPYSLILLGDDMLLFDREEYDQERGTWRALAPGDPGRDNR
jgi:hypothetical protein